mmetsp:Transcript_40209/g.159783  ORF Transcript_40209/g.159783 Transcript_40209/m.159783 type:complete len:105 (-) Transcript_40209:1549-1863(-)
MGVSNVPELFDSPERESIAVDTTLLRTMLRMWWECDVENLQPRSKEARRTTVFRTLCGAGQTQRSECSRFTFSSHNAGARTKRLLRSQAVFADGGEPGSTPCRG